MGIEEDDLHAYVDERLDAARRAEVDALLFLDPALRRQVDDWKLQRTLLRQAFAAAAKVPPALDVAQMVAHRAPPHARLRLAAGIVLGLAIGAGAGAGGGWYARGLQRPGEIARIAIEATTAHAVFAADEMHPVEMDAQNRAQLVEWVSHRLGRRIDIPDLGALGYHFIGGRIVAAWLGPAALLMYEDGTGNRISVFVLPMHGALTEPLQAIEGVARGQAAAAPAGYAWINNRIGYSVVSRHDAPGMQVLAEQVRTAMR